MPDLDRIQSLIVQSAPQPRCFVLLFRLGPPDGARRFLRQWLPYVPSAAADSASFPNPVFLSLTWQGLARLCEGDPDLDPGEGVRRLERWFVDQTPDHPAVARDMGFLGESAPQRWWNQSFTNADIHLAVHAFFAGEAEADAGVGELRTSARAAGLEELELPTFAERALNGRRPAGGILHFGYRDGISGPDVDWADDGSGSVSFREFLLGYHNDDYPVDPFAPGPWRELVRDGSFACIAWIYQNVAAFNRYLDEASRPLQEVVAPALARGWLAAKLMGRWPDGSPISRWPLARPEQPDLDDKFGFEDDPVGERCPLNAHIRIVNTRNQPLSFANRARFPKGPPRFLRRGFSYGPELAGAKDDGRQRGIVGTFFCARINEQFYTTLRWMQKTEFAPGFERPPYTEGMQDALFGCREKPGSDPRLPLGPAGAGAILQLRDFITYRGVTALLTPSLPALEKLARSS